MTKLEISVINVTIGKRHILQNISLHVSSGEIVGLLGPNGCGKTTLFSTIIGSRKPTSGHIILSPNQDLTALPIHQRVHLGLGYLPQESSVFRDLSVEENILLPLELYIKDTAKRQDRLHHLLSEFQLERLKDQKAKYLSGGERRRLEIARALSTNPKFLLLDEPLAAIDPLTIEYIKKTLHYLKSLNIGILITDHNVPDTLDIIDRGYLLYQGKILCEGTKDTLLHHPKAQDVYFGGTY
ncbi:MAG: LPS export ABC transporter ATP-binding protein [Pseudomonadota bacterium]